MGRLTARWGAALRIARRDATRHKGRTALVLAMIALPVLGAVLIGTVLRSSVALPAVLAQTELGPAAQASIVDGGCAPYLQLVDGGGGCAVDDAPEATAGPAAPEERPPLTTEQLARVVSSENRVVEERIATVSVSSGDRLVGRQSLTELPADALADVYVVADGVLPSTPGEVAVGSDLVDRLDLGLGDVIEVGADADAVEVHVVGVLTSRNLPSAPVVAVSGTVPDTRPYQWYVLGGAPVTWDDVLALNEVGASVRSRAVILDPPPASAVPANEVFDTGSAMDLAGLGFVGAIVAIALLEVVLLVGPAFAVGARRSTRQLALVAASGGEPRDTRRIVLASGVVLGALAGVVGAVLGVVAGGVVYVATLARGAGMPNFRVPLTEMVGAVVLAVLLGLAAAWIPARSAARADVVAALAGRRAEARPRRAVPWVGVAVAVLGLVAAVVGAALAQTVALVVGVVVLEIGLVMAAGGLITLVGRMAGRLRLAGRIAARDAARQRGRTAPAVAAVLAAVAGATAGAMYFAADQHREEAAWEAQLGIGTLTLMSATPEGLPPGRDDVTRDVAALERTIPLADVAEVFTLAPVVDSAEVDGGGPEPISVWAQPEVEPASRCPLDDLGDDATAEQRDELADDPRCTSPIMWSSGMWGGYGASGVVVDDGTAVALWGMPGAREAAAALARGEVLVPSERYVYDDGTAHVAVSVWDERSGESRDVELVIPAYVVDWDRYAFALPRSVIDAREDLSAALTGVVAQPVETPTTAQVDAANAEIRDGGSGWLSVQEPYSSDVAVLLLVMVGVAAFIGLGATWMSVGLAAAESRPDLATLAAVGASPRTRRRVAGAQAGIVAVLGVGLGVVTGVLLGWVLVLWQASNAANVYDDQGDWLLVWPWPALVAIAVGIPLLAVAGAWLTTPSRLPLARRLAQ